MSRIREWFSRLWGTVRANPGDAEMEEELRLHLELATEDMQRWMGATEDADDLMRLLASECEGRTGGRGPVGFARGAAGK